MINKMKLWGYVLKHKHITPGFLVVGELPDDLASIAVGRDNFVVETERIDNAIPSIHYRRPDQLVGDDRLEYYSKIDYMLCSREDKDVWLPALFCGVSVMYDSIEFADAIMKNAALSPQERVANFEKAEAI